MKLSDRLEMVIAAVQPAACVADVGTDHGFVPAELVKRGIAGRAVAMDVRPGPLSRAAEHVRALGLEEKIETRLSDGLSGLSAGEAETIVIAGLGGELMIRILDEGRHMWEGVGQWVLSPHTDLCRVRRWLWENGFAIGREDMVCEAGKYYTVLSAAWKPGETKGAPAGKHGRTEDVPAREPKPWECLCGRYLPEMRHPVLFRYIKDEERKLEELIGRLSAPENRSLRILKRLSEAEKELSLYRSIEERFFEGK